MHPRKVENGSYRSNRMIVRNGLIKTKRIEKLTLVAIEPPHHRSPPQRIALEEQNHCSAGSPTTFATWGNSGIEPDEGKGISSPEAQRPSSCGLADDGERKWSTMSDWTCR